MKFMKNHYYSDSVMLQTAVRPIKSSKCIMMSHDTTRVLFLKSAHAPFRIGCLLKFKILEGVGLGFTFQVLHFLKIL